MYRKWESGDEFFSEVSSHQQQDRKARNLPLLLDCCSFVLLYSIMSDESDSSCSEEDENILSSSITDYQFFQACENGDLNKVKAILTAKPEWLNKVYL